MTVEELREALHILSRSSQIALLARAEYQAAGAAGMVLAAARERLEQLERLERRDDSPTTKREFEMIGTLRRLVDLFDGAMPISPKRAWEEALSKGAIVIMPDAALIDRLASLIAGWEPDYAEHLASLILDTLRDAQPRGICTGGSDCSARQHTIGCYRSKRSDLTQPRGGE